MPATPPNFQASGDIRPCRFVTQDGDFTVAESNANDRIVGVAQEGTRTAPISDVVLTNLAASVGESLKVYGDGEECLIELGDTVVVATEARLKADADGKGVPVLATGTTIQQFGGFALQGGIAGDYVRMSVQPGSFRPALS